MSHKVENYNQHIQWRTVCVKRFGTIKDLPVVNPHKIAGDIIAKYCESVLDFGCGVHKVHKNSYKILDEKYFSLDSDPDGDFDYNSLNDIPDNKKFDFVILNQVIEHIPFNDCMKLINKLSGFVNMGGHMFITIPNVQHPVRYWGDLDHVTPWTYEDIFGLFKNTGFEVEQLARFNKNKLPVNPVKRYIINAVCDIFRVDWCDSIMGLGKKVVDTKH